MPEITKEQLLSYDNAGRARILRDIVLGLVKYIGDEKKWKLKVI